jgi:hypothetical protein
MKVCFRGKSLTLDDGMLLGQGGEARVYRHPQLPLALKIFHDIEKSLPPVERALRQRVAALRVEKLRALTAAAPRRMPAGVIAPEELVTDQHGDVIGYAMACVDHAIDLAVLAHKKNKAAGSFDQMAVLAIFRALRAIVAELHKVDVIVGDFNDGNVVVRALEPFVIDADSMQIGALPCPVAHERFLDPRLYGRPLVDQACFDADSDHYALRVLLFQSLLCLHPYGGVHATLPTLLRRAEAGWSILRGDVQVPRAAVPFATLSDDLLHDFERCFDRGERAPLNERLLETRFTSCSCGVEHARTCCPACSTRVQAPAIRTSGGVREETVVQTRGVVLQARIVTGQVAFLVDEGGSVRRENHDAVIEGARPPFMRFEIAGDATWVGHEGQLVKLRGGTVVDRALTGTMRGAPVFAAGSAGLFVLEGDVLVHHESRARVGRVLEQQTTLASSGDGGLALFRAGRMLVAYAFRAGARGTEWVDAEVLQPEGKLVDLQVSFADSGEALVGLACDLDGKRTHSLALLDARGRRIASTKGAPDSTPVLESIAGKLLAPGRGGLVILSASSAGIVAVDVDAKGGRLHAGALFEDTRPFVDASVELLPGSGGSLVVVSPQAITRLRLSGRSATAP